MNKKQISRLIIVLTMVLFILCSAAFAESYTASSMRLIRYDGDVTIEDAGGKPRFVIENVRFASGEAMITGESAYASVGLDSTKIVTLDENSRVEFINTGDHMELTLTEGVLFLDVSEKLDENESLDIKTSTMTVGIRGTIVVVANLPAGDKRLAALGISAEKSAVSADGAMVSVLGVLEGTARITHAGDEGKAAYVSAGQIAVVSGEMPKEVEASEMTYDNLSPFVMRQILEEEVTQRVIEACPGLFDDYPYTADADWEYTGKVMIIAQSASKLYDGNPLTRAGDILVYGLPEEFGISAYAGGAQTDAGESENPIAAYTITNMLGEDISDHFPEIETVSGRLVVDPAPMTVWTGSAVKAYDGTPLTNEEAGFDLISGNRKDELWRNTSLVLSEAEGETLYGISGAVLVHGTNPLTGETKEIMLNAGQKLTVRLSDEERGDSIEFLIENVSAEEIPEEVLRLYADNPELLAQACEDAGWDIEEVNALIAALPERNEQTTQKDGLTISVSTAGGLRRELTNARINIDTDITDYSGRALSGEEAHFAEVRIDDSVTVTATGSQTEVGESENTYEIDWGTEDLNNFIITEELGTLRVVQPLDGVTITANSASKVYDGKALYANSATVTGLPDGYSIETEVRGYLTDAGSAGTAVTSYKVFDPDGEDVTELYPDLKTKMGSLTIEPAPLTITTGSAEKIYDGQPLTAEDVSISGLIADETATVTAAGALTDAGSTENTYEISWGSAKAGNYTITEELGTLTVEPLSLNIDMGAASAEYSGGLYVPAATVGYNNGEHAGETVSGTRLRAMEIVYRYDLFTGDSLELTISGSGSDAGEYTLKTGVSLSGNAGNFTLPEATEYTVEIQPAPLTIATGSAEKVYDGTALSCGEVTVTGLMDGDSITVTAVGEQTDAGESDNTYEIDWGDVNSANYTVIEEMGVLSVTPLPVTITMWNETYPYQGGYASKRPAISSENTDFELSSDEMQQDVPYTHWYISWGWGDVLEFDISAGKDVGAYTCSIDGVTAQGSAKIGNYEISYVGNPSTFTICALNVYFYLGGSSQDRAYSEEATMLSPRGYYQNGPYGNSYFEPDAITGEVGNMQAHFTLFTGDEIVLSISGWDEGDVGTHTIEATPAVVKGNASNYSTGLYQKTYKVIAAPLTVTTSTESKVYDGTPLTGKATLTGLADWDKDKVTATASSLTDAGSVSNTCTIDWGEVNPANYTITEEIGKLTVTPLEVSVDLGGGEYVYGDTYDAPRLTYKNGEHEEENATGECVSDGKTESVWKLALDTGDTLSLIIEKTEASLTGACEIGEPDGEDRASCYTVSFTNGDLTLAPLQIQVDLCGRDRVFGEYESGAYYDGYFSDFPLTYMNGQCKGENVEQTGYASGMGTSKVSYSAFTGEEFELSITNYCEKNAGTYTVGRTLTMTEGDDHLLDFSYINGSYTVSKRPVTVATSTENKVFDGTPLTGTATIKNVVTYKGEPDSRVTVTATGTLTDAGAADNTCTIDWGGADPANFDVTQELGTLSVEPLEIVIRLYDKTMEYFGKPIVSAYWDGYGNGTRAGDTLDWTGEYTAEADGSQKLIFTLCSGDTLTAVIPGFGPDVGSYSLMPSWTISGNAANYTVSVSGCTGTITPAPLTVSTQSADKVYDGTPLTAPGTISGLIDADAGKVSVITAGITDAGTADNTYTIDWGTVNPDNYTVTSGTLGTLTVEKLILNFSVSDVTHTYTTSLPTVPFPTVSLTYGNGGHAGETVSYTSRQYNGYLETGVVTAEPFFYTLFTGDRVCQYVSGMKQDVGTYTITAPCCGVADDDTNMSNFSASCNTAAWTVTPRGLTVTTSSASKPYDGTPLTSGSVTVSGLTDLDAAKITVTATGTITDFGTAVNTYAIDWGGVNPDNYTVTENLGTLKIEKTDMPITLTSADAEGVYTPWGLSNSNYTVEGLPAGFTLTAEITGLQTVGGSSSNTIASWTITNANGEDVTEYFTGVTPVEGTLTLTKAKIDIWSVNETFIYGSGWHSSHIYYSGAYSADNPSGQISSYNPATVKDAGTYEATFTVGEIRSDLQDRYELGTITFGTIKIEPLKLTVNLDGRTLTYNGDFVSLPVPSLTIENGDHAGETLAPSSTDGDAFNLEAKFDLFTGDTVTVTILNFDVIYAGTYDITYTCDAGTNFSVEFTGKTVTVKPTALTISTDNETKVYDGGMLPSTTKPPVLTGSCDDVIYTESTAEWFSDVGTRENSGKIVWNGADENNYTVTEDFGTLTIEELQLEIDLHGQTVESDWTFDLENPTMKYLNGAHPGESVPGTQTDPTSDGDVTFTLFTGETIRVVVARPPEEPGTYTLSATVTCSGRKENFLFSYTGAQFVINP